MSNSVTPILISQIIKSRGHTFNHNLIKNHWIDKVKLPIILLYIKDIQTFRFKNKTKLKNGK